ncbi:MAG: Ig-like domain-containing protein, partial [Anaerolineales bacterium]|nr:Ig-like domain-containing protein [Anaerolineales bacterium]
MSAKPNFRRKRSLLLILTLFVVGLVGAGGVWWWQNRDRAEPGEGGLVVRVETGGAATEAVLTGGGTSDAQLVLTLSAGQAEPKTAARIALAEGTPLSEAEIEAILARLPELLPEDGDVVEFSLPTETLPPPQTGDRVDVPFPPPDAPPAVVEVPTGPLEVLRFSPEGPIPLAPFLSVTFNQPMVPLATVEMLSATEVPVNLTPALPGVWRWLGTQTLTFEYEGDEDFPKATEFVAEIPAGTLSAAGNALAETVTWTFTTPPPQVTRFYPSNGPQKLDPLFFVAFNQQIDPAAVLATINMTNTSLRLATADEIAEDETVALMAESTRAGTWLAFRPTERLEPDTTYDITIGPGTPSAEGPLLTEEPYNNSIYTYGPLEIVRADCAYYSGECPPLTPLQIVFSNPLDTAVFTDTMIGIDPDLPGAIVEVFGNTISIRGATVGQTTYNVFLSGDIQDIFGQTLGDDETRNFKVSSALPGLYGPDQPFVTLDPSLQRPVLSVFAINYSRLEIEAYRVTPADWQAYLVYQDEYRYEDNPPSPPGERVLNTTVDLDAADDVLTEVPIELEDALDGTTGHLLVIIKPPAREIPDRYSESSQTKVVWLQVTQIGLDAVADDERLVAWATDLATGAPLSGVQLALGNSSATTAADGLAELDARQGGVLVATLGEDVAILPHSYYRWDEASWAVYEAQDELRWYVTDDRRLYQPGETIHAKGWLRLIGQQLGGDVGLVDGLQGINFEVYDPQGNLLTSGTAPASSLGGFDLSFELPDNSNLGDAYIQLTATGAIPGDGRTYYHYFQIQEFRRPEFEVTARNETTGPYFVGGSATVATTAEYFAGGPLPNAEVNWLVQASPSSYQPPNWPGFVFGSWTPWWYYDYFYAAPAYEEDVYYGGPVYEESRVQTFSGVTDASGTHYLQIDFEAMSRPQPFSVMAEATVFDVNRQAWTGATSLLVHPADLYVGLH